MKNQKEIEEWKEAKEWYDGLYDTDREKYFMIKYLLKSEKDKWKQKMLEIMGEDEDENSILYGASQAFIHRNQLRQQLREKVEKL